MWLRREVPTGRRVAALYCSDSSFEAQQWAIPTQLLGSGTFPSPGIPSYRTRLIGRDAETESAVSLIRRPEVGLVTFTGPSGVGKTRLALASVSALELEFTDGTVVVPLSGLPAGADVFASVARALGLEERPDGSWLEAVAAYLRRKHVLLLLDNFEHVMGSA